MMEQESSNRKMFLYLVLILMTALTDPAACCDVESFISDFADLYSISNVAVLVTLDQLDQPLEGLSIAYLSYGNQELQNIVEYIDTIQNDIEAIFFIGSGHSDVIQMLANSTNIFHSHIVSVMQNYEDLDLKLRLDTNIIFCTQEGRDYALTEKYAIKDGPIVEEYFGNWSSESGLKINSPLIWERRTDLMNITLIDSVLEYSVISMLSRSENGEIQGQSGIGPDILATLKEKLNFSTRAVSPEDGEWGSIKADNFTWSGMVGDLLYKRADISTALLSFTLERSKAIDFSITIIEFVVTLIQPLTISSEINAWAYLTIFPVLAWIIILGMVFISSLLLSIIANYLEKVDINLLDAISISFSYLLQWSHEKPDILKTRAAKVGLFTWALGCYMVFSFYEADLTATMTSGPPESRIK